MSPVKDVTYVSDCSLAGTNRCSLSVGSLELAKNSFHFFLGHLERKEPAPSFETPSRARIATGLKRERSGSSFFQIHRFKLDDGRIIAFYWV
jgi:hypothetical protein